MNKSVLGLIRSYRAIAGLAMVCMSVTVSAELTQQQRAIFQSSKQRSEQVDLGELIGSIGKQQSKGAAMIDGVVDKSVEISMGQGEGKTAAEERARALCEARTHYLFASRSLGQVALEEIFEEASANPELTIVFQGIPKGSKMPQGFLDLQRMASKFDPVPSVALNPLLFQRHEVTAVPELIALTEGEWRDLTCHQDVRTRVAGITTMRFLEDRLDEGDLGQHGPVQDISEPNLMEVIEKRISQVDWDEKKKRAVDNVWNNIQMYPLPPAPKNRIIKIDPTIEARQNILDAEGNILVPAGKRVNPLDIQPFNAVVLVFNPLRESELKAAKEIVREYTQKGKKIIPVLSEIDKSEGWDMYNEVAEVLQHQVYMLTPDLKQRFRIMHTMSIVRASEDYFELREVKTEM